MFLKKLHMSTALFHSESINPLCAQNAIGSLFWRSHLRDDYNHSVLDVLIRMSQ